MPTLALQLVTRFIDANLCTHAILYISIIMHLLKWLNG